ncbi:MAG: hypothetical protein A3F12_06290 [Gammaproteobacteria bacterium RIFCSPHIGHO2_12_FULL_38_14]|nr:MAG: hypothetical protein A3F12_06290 [Gammaproteobacteria bacterium RIFCSPHIGHO2_12_FULL_38_14]
MQHFFIGVDGGATKCTVAIEDESGALLGEVSSGAANIRNSIEQSWDSIYSCINKILTPLSLSLADGYFHAGMGLAGCEVQSAYEAFLQSNHAFKTLKVVSDAHTACLGAHNGQDGAIIIVGTGVVGFQLQQGQATRVSGWGFPLDDEGSGAWLGLQALKMTVRMVDQRLPHSSLTEAVLAHFEGNPHHIVYYAHTANSTAYATFAPFVIEHAKQGDALAVQLIQQAAHAIDEVAFALFRAEKSSTTPLAYALVGGITTFIEPYLHQSLRARLHPCKLSPAKGAIQLIKNHVRGI